MNPNMKKPIEALGTTFALIVAITALSIGYGLILGALGLFFYVFWCFPLYTLAAMIGLMLLMALSDA